jgi:isopentenyldiphosphate isomerase|nr:8-oxo-dGTP diphosphatase [uncultured Lachnoanaerobaculum sp.]
MRKMKLCTLCYIERDDKYLMLHRVSKKNDINKDKWIGVGGHFEDLESPDECLIREVREETGYELKDFDFRGIVTFVYGKKNEEFIEYMHLFVGRNVVGEPIECNEGVLRWVDKKEVLNLNLWEGDRIFLRLLEERKDFFSLKLVYGEDESLKEAVLDGKSLDV